MIKNTLKLFVALLLLITFSDQSRGQTIQYDLVATGFNSPIDIRFVDNTRMFIAEQSGSIKIVENGSTLAQPFLDISNKTTESGERGLLGLAFHPSYMDNGYFFVNYTDNGGTTVISRYTVSADANIADPASEKIIIEIDQPFGNHNGGCIQFGPDGYLYIGMGDGGSGGDPQDNGQSRSTLLGKMLRIDIDTEDPYVIPPSNPFAEDDFTLDEIWALGLRNPWRFSFDMGIGDMWIADVGQNAFEEINMQSNNSSGGENYGWRCKEADTDYNLTDCPDEATFTNPVLSLPQGPDCSVTGGYVYRGSNIQSLAGVYVFGDFCSGHMYTLVNDNGSWESDRLPDVNNPSTFGQDLSGEMYYAEYSAGDIYKINMMPVGTEDLSEGLAGFSLTPNPTSDHFTINLNEEIDLGGRYQIVIYDVQGSLMYDRDYTDTDYVEIASKDWPAGSYLVQLVTNEKIYNQKIIIAK